MQLVRRISQSNFEASRSHKVFICAMVVLHLDLLLHGPAVSLEVIDFFSLLARQLARGSGLDSSPGSLLAHITGNGSGCRRRRRRLLLENDLHQAANGLGQDGRVFLFEAEMSGQSENERDSVFLFNCDDFRSWPALTLGDWRWR